MVPLLRSRWRLDKLLGEKFVEDHKIISPQICSGSEDIYVYRFLYSCICNSYPVLILFLWHLPFPIPGWMLGCFQPDFISPCCPSGTWVAECPCRCLIPQISFLVPSIVRHRVTHIPFLTFHLVMSFLNRLPSLFPTQAYGFIFPQWPHLPFF